jgi:hypothetical protein
VWVFDPQRLIDEPPRWWWNPLSYVSDEVKTATLADVFTAAHTDPAAHTDAFFDPEGQKVIAALLLAAALAGRTIEHAYLWVTDPRDDEPVSILREPAHRLLAGLAGGRDQRARQATRRRLRHRPEDPRLPHQPPRPRLGHPRARPRRFDPHAFVRGTGTLYTASPRRPRARRARSWPA